MFCAILGATVLVVCLHWTGLWNTRGGSEAAVAEDTSRRRRVGTMETMETMLDQVPGLTEA